MTTLLDASAILTLLNEETGADQVEQILGDAAMSSVNVSEVAAKLHETSWSLTDIGILFEQLQINILSFDLITALKAGELCSVTKKYGLSLGDRACIATGLIYQYDIMTADKAWLKLKIPTLKISSVRI